MHRHRDTTRDTQAIIGVLILAALALAAVITITGLIAAVLAAGQLVGTDPHSTPTISEHS
jgi:hypothetical protein